MKRVLITGAQSYIGDAFAAWVRAHYAEQISVQIVDMRSSDWKKVRFSQFDAVFHVAGIAHADVGKATSQQQQLYYAVNRDLAVETARMARMQGVRQFIFMSSMIVYGNSAPAGKTRVITKDTEPAPANFYADSKWQAEQALCALRDDTFAVAILRPPMIYGPGSKGNYPVLAKLAKRLPVFADVPNARSMLYIENLCAFVALLVCNGGGGVFFPQNAEQPSTSELVGLIARACGHRIWISRLFNPAVYLAGYVPGKIGVLCAKAFGGMVYDASMSLTFDGSYRVTTLESSIHLTHSQNQHAIEKHSMLSGEN